MHQAQRYTADEASRYLRLPLATLRAWVGRRDTKTGAALTGLPRRGAPCLSFDDLIELADLAATRLGGHAELLQHCVEKSAPGVPTKFYLPSAKGSSSGRGEIVIDPCISFGQPVLAGTGIRVEIIADRFGAGESIDSLASDYAHPREAIQAVLRWLDALPDCNDHISRD